MADINQTISLGIGTPSGIPEFLTLGFTGAWRIVDVDLDDTIVDAQTGVVVAISGTVSATGKTVWLKQGTDWVEQTVTAQTPLTITVTYGGVLSAGAATLYVRNPL